MNHADPSARPDPLRSASRRLRTLLTEPDARPARVELMQFLDLLEEHAACSAVLNSCEPPPIAERLARIERMQLEVIRLLYRLLNDSGRRGSHELGRLAEHLDRLDQALGGS